MTRRTKLCAWLAALLATGVAGTIAAGFALARPYRVAAGPPPADLAIESVTIASASGSDLRAWLVRGDDAHGAVLVLHGLHSSRRAMVPRARFLARAGYTVLLADLQAQGESPGETITFGGLEARDAEACLAFLRDRFPAKPLGAIGVSMGGAALVLARDRPPLRALVLEATFASLEQATSDRLRRYLGPAGPLLAPLLLLQMEPVTGVDPASVAPLARIAEIGCPLLVLHGTGDRSTRLAQSRALFAAAREPKEFWSVEGADHVDLHAFAPEEYERRVLAFLAAHLR